MNRRRDFRPLDLSEGLTVLAIGAHVDDIELGCGATLLSLIEAHGCKVHAAVFCGHARVDGAPERREEAEHAADLGGYTLTIFSFEDGEFPANRREIRSRIARLRDDIHPDLVFAPHPQDNHQDHEALAVAVRREMRCGESVWHYEIPQFGTEHRFVPNVYFDVSLPTDWSHDGYEEFADEYGDTFATKKAFLLRLTMASQRGKPLLDPRHIMGLMRTRGLQAGRDVVYAEAFSGRTILG